MGLTNWVNHNGRLRYVDVSLSSHGGAVSTIPNRNHNLRYPTLRPAADNTKFVACIRRSH